MYWFLLLSLFKFLPLGWILSRNESRLKDPNNSVPRDEKWALTISPPSVSWAGVPAFFSFFSSFFIFSFFLISFFCSQAWSESVHSLLHLCVFSFPGFGLFGCFFVFLVFPLLCMWIFRTFCENKGSGCCLHPGVVQDSDASFLYQKSSINS